MDINPLKVQQMFFGAGSLLFSIGALGQIYSLWLTWHVINFGAKLSASSQLVFNIILALFFYSMFASMRKQLKEQKSIEQALDEKVKL
jgi:hypothetical protein